LPLAVAFVVLTVHAVAWAQTAGPGYGYSGGALDPLGMPARRPIALMCGSIALLAGAVSLAAALLVARRMKAQRGEALAVMGMATAAAIVVTWVVFVVVFDGPAWQVVQGWLLPGIGLQLAALGIAVAVLDRLGWLGVQGHGVSPVEAGRMAPRAEPLTQQAVDVRAAPAQAAPARPQAAPAPSQPAPVPTPRSSPAPVPAPRAAAPAETRAPSASRATAPAAAPAAGGARPRVFISYRRSDSSDVTGRIHDRLSASLGRDHVFTDVDSIPLGVDFREHVTGILAHTDCMLAVIGREWVKATDAAGRRRLDDPADLVRIEVETALARGVPVIPLLVQGAAMPVEAELPPGLRGLAFRNGMAVRPNPDFHRDVDRLEHQLMSLAARARPAGA
jgi:hypothetical protein